ncbi:MAG: D-alanyl-D-alanine carboxypeptidase [Robiginitomaculum sp.]|nr:MAG: D-alanyl-D-alanine carboxypeptidase [Robiginitomaculum sp.]
MIRNFIRLCVIFTLLVVTGSGVFAHAKANKYASIIIDADSLEILHARKIDEARYPASLTKMMTLYLTFDALERGELTLDEALPVSARAARTPPVRLGLRAGRTITVEQAILALTVRSANDAAAVLAERLGGSQSEFATAMTSKAKALGMRATVFRNPHGLPDEGQITTARDMAKLAEALLSQHAKYYPYFSKRTFTYRGRTYKNHNALLGKVEGVDGFKTGYTNASGYNLVLSAKRENRRIIAIVLGGASGRSRDKHMADLIERGFDVMKRNAKTAQKFALNADERRPKIDRRALPVPPIAQSYTLRTAHEAPARTVHIVSGVNGMHIPPVYTGGWAVQIGAYTHAVQAHSVTKIAQADTRLGLSAAIPQIIPVQRTNGFIYRARLSGLTHAKAINVCKTLAARGHSCLVVAPS